MTSLVDHVDLDVQGMTCAACALRIEKKLNKLDGVQASVNYATEKASVDFDPARMVPSDLITTVQSIGYDATLPTVGAADAAAAPPAAPGVDPLLQRLIVATVLGVPVLLLSMVPALQFRNWQWIAFTLASPVATWAAWPFHRAAWRNLRQAEASMDTLVSLGVSAAYLWSAYALLFTDAGDSGMSMPMSLASSVGESTHLYLEVASTTVALILAGRYFESRAKRQAGGALRALLERGAFEANVVDASGIERRVPVAELKVGDQFVVRPGERIATDGVVADGASSVDTSLVTGESVPRDVAVGDAVTGATINVNGRLVVRATRVGADTTLAQMARLVERAQSGKAPVQRLADRVAGVFVPVVVALAVATLGFWFGRTGSLSQAMGPAMAVLIIACPCALGLATPTALLVGTGRGAQMGVLIKGPEVLESTRRVDTVVLDKTGTITTGMMQVFAIEAVPEYSDHEVLGWAAAVEAASEHPIARAISTHARTLGVDVPAVAQFVNEPGVGAHGVVDLGDGTTNAVTVRRAGPGLATEPGSGAVPAAASGAASGAVPGAVSGAVPGAVSGAVPGVVPGAMRAATVVEVVVNRRVIGRIALADSVKPTSRDGIAALRALGLRPVLLTGDAAPIAAAVAAEVGIDPADVFAEVLPAGKVAVVRALQADGRVVAMVGDGVNDAAALAQADLGIAMGSGTDVAIEASDLTVMRAEIPAVVDAVRLSRRTLATIKGNLFWAFAYNVAALPLAATGRLSPVLASAAMAFSSVFVVSNSLRLRRFRSV